jgi:transcriptional regulator with XRE-family HTH domain
MQAVSVFHQLAPYDDGMTKGRPSKQPRSPLGERLAAARERMGLSQVQLADKLGVTQKLITYWEHNDVALRVDQLTAIAKALHLPVDELLGQPAPKARGSGPVGKARQIFEAVSRLPRKQQEKVFDILQPFIKEHLQTANNR